MPIQNKDLGKYNRPGIFINEIDNSIIELPSQDILINLVPGFSKKGPVNKPVYCESKADFIAIFGDIDRGLERKDSYFHRTCIKMLESGPIYALNLLLTDDDRDKANWKTLSCASEFKNDTTKQMPYSRLFNRQDFWQRDDESFLDYVNDPQIDYDRILHLSNLGNKVTTTFIFKSKTPGFDISAEDWYGGVTKVPAYINPKDWISDYMVSIIILDGDWTQYDVLTTDQTWGQYFSNTGLNKDTIQDFVNEPNVNVLGYYDASLIPYFKDITGRDMYIKSLINNDTDKTGLFCAYFEDEMLDADFPIGKVDLIGDGLVGKTQSSIEFLSYKEDIFETLTYNITELNSCGNVFGNYSSDLSTDFISGRTSECTNHFVNGMSFGNGGLLTASTLVELDHTGQSTGKSWFFMSSDVDFTAPAPQQLLVIGDAVVFNKAFDTIEANKTYYIEDVSDGGRMVSISETLGGNPIGFSNALTLTDMFIQRVEFNIGYTLPYFVLDNTKYTINSGQTEFTVKGLEFTTPSDTLERYDVLYLTKGDDATVNILTGQQSTTGAEKPNFLLDYNDNIILGYLHLTVSSGNTPATGATDNVITAEYTPITIDTNGYVPLTGIIINSGSTVDNYIKLSFNNTSGTTDYTNYNQIRYRNAYDEIESKLDDGKGVIINHSDASKFYITQSNMGGYGYNNTIDGLITINVGSLNPSDFYDTDTYKWLVYYLDNEFVLNENNCDRAFTSALYVDSLVGSGQTPSTNAGVIGKYSNIYMDYYNGILNNGDYAYMNNDTGSTTKFMIKAWIQDDNILYIDFMGEDGISPYPIEIANYNNEIIFYSSDSNYKQSVEIESFDTSKPITSIYEINVDAVRYSELVKGDFLEAYYDVNEIDNVHGEDPRKLTRIVKVLGHPTIPNLKVISCDAPIKINTYNRIGGGYDYQTTTYPTIEKYVSDYKGIKLIPFTINNASIPNGTETRQSEILDLLLPTTNLGKGLINKNKISWRYLIDSFGLGLTSKSKQQYSDLLGKKLNSFGFISAPSVKTLKHSTNPSFINDDVTLNTEFLKNGGDETKNPSFLYSFAEGIGRSTIGYFFPYVTVDDQGVPKDVPPAAYVASTYMKKFLASSSAIQPWTIAAGITNGRVTDISQVEMDFNDDQLADLYSMGLNPIVKKKNAGFCINSESTAQVFPQSSLSIIHSREVLIELENALYDMLLRYQWRFNTGAIRAEIKYKADKICTDIQNRDGLYDFKNIIDETNNTNYIIDLQMGVLDTFIEIIKGMGIIVNNITILKKGDIQSGGFQ